MINPRDIQGPPRLTLSPERGTSAVTEGSDERRRRTIEEAMYQVLVVAITAIACIWFVTSACSAEPIGAAGEKKTVAHELKALLDPTILIRRIWLDSEWNKFKDDSSDLQQTLGGAWAWRISGRADWGVRLKVPIKRHFSGDADDDGDKRGLGDIELATGTAFRLSDTWRAGGGMQLRMPSGTDISDNTWRLQEFGAVAWDARPWLTFSPSFEHNHSVAEQRGAAPEHFLELFFPAILLMPSQWAVTASYEPKIDFEKNSSWTHSAKLQLAKRLEELPLGFFLSIKKPFNGDKQFQVNFVSTYYFSSK
jgi:hypothetical protein